MKSQKKNNKMNPYENVQIGNFLMAFGYNLHKIETSGPVTVSMNLLQQTPLDAKIGDVFGAMDGKFFIIEFKRNEKSIETEYKKAKYHELSGSSSQLGDIANICHLLSFGVATEENQFDYIFISYISLTEAFIEFDSINEFITELFNTDSRIGVDYESFKQYLELLNTSSGNQSSSTNGGQKSKKGNLGSSETTPNKSVENMHGLIVYLDAKNKLVQCIFNSLDELNKMLGIGYEQNKEMDRTKQSSNSRSM